MAKVLTSFDFPAPVAKSTHPWDQWFDGKIRVLTKGEDFDCKGQTIGMMARSRGRKKGYTVRVSVDNEAGTVVLQAIKDNTPVIGVAEDGKKGKKAKAAK